MLRPCYAGARRLGHFHGPLAPTSNRSRSSPRRPTSCRSTAAAERRAHAGAGVPQLDDGGSACLFESVIGGEKVGRYSFLAADPFLLLEARGKRTVTSTIESHARSSVEVRQSSTPTNPLEDAPRAGASRSASPSCPSCRRSSAAPSATPATTRSATSRTCRTPRPTTAACPTCRSPFTTTWSCSTTSSKTVIVVALADVARRRRASRELAPRRLRRRLPPRRSPRRKTLHARPTRSPPADIDTAGDRAARLPIELHAARVRSTPSASASNTSAPATSFRSSSASGWSSTRAPTVRNLPHAAGREPQPVHVLPADARRDARRQLAGDHGPRRRRQGHRPPARRHAPPRRAPTKKTAGWPRSCWPIPRSGPST